MFVISALLVTGVFATGAYFQFQDDQTFTIASGEATLWVTTEDSNMAPGDKVGPGYSGFVCVKILNDGDYTLRVTESLAFPIGEPGLLDAVGLNFAFSTGGCPAAGSSFPALRDYIGYTQELSASLAPGASVYVRQTLGWIETGTDQSALMNKALDINGTITGRTLP